MTIQAKQIVVHGRVQGVGFRYFVQRAGNRLGLTGNVCNRPDDTVAIFVEGQSEAIGEFLKAVARGPSMARVERLEVQEVAPTGRYRIFQIEGW